MAGGGGQPSKPEPELLPDGSILVPVPGDDEHGYSMARLVPGQPEHAEWLAYIQRMRAASERGTGASEPAARRPAASPAKQAGRGRKRVALGTFALLGIAAAAFAVLFFTKAGPFERSDHSKPAATPAVPAATNTRADYDECKAQVGGLLDAEETLESHLSVGMQESDYTSEVGDVRAEYDRIPIDDLSPECLEVGRDLEKALNTYAKVATIWNNCITDIDCSSDSIKPKLQDRWLAATVEVASAKSKLDALKGP